ncbi:DMT family transporter [Limoniibacter endophyticus]|uniref:Multidrug DMT transporter permease n=1 Tax=Limoniibacter endophyticus TaxID=1565040 RepID=A0A8J3DPG8_9HYPH|nr:DMT family transporter [Limoniibacter endophyticus]GHC69094.1 multidrug DMT transporter permease [Limoniibacter endophyticus]
MGNTQKGIFFGIIAGALWGIVFLAPKLVENFTPLQLAASRYLAFGAMAIIMVAGRFKRICAHLGGPEWRALVWLSLLGNIIYYIFIGAAVQLGGVALTSIIIGFLPVAVTVVGSRDHGAVPLRTLAPSLLLGAGGILCISWETLSGSESGFDTASLLGLLCAICALTSWTSFAVGNSRWLGRLDQLTPDEWNMMTGVVTGALALVLILPAFVFTGSSHSAPDWLYFIGISLAVAFLASIIGNACWNRMSRLLPLTLVGQMILFETLFALLYGFLWEQRLPTILEIVAMLLVSTSVILCVTAHRSKPQPA